MKPHAFRRWQAIAAVASVSAVLVWSCGEQPTSAPVDWRSPEAPLFSQGNPDDVYPISVPIGSPSDPRNAVSLPTFQHRTLMRIVMKGFLHATNGATTHFAGPDGRQLFGNCSLRSGFTYRDSENQVIASWNGNCGTPNSEEETWTGSAYGTGVTSIGVGLPDFTHSGSREVTITVPRPKLKLLASYYAIDHDTGKTITFTADITPDSAYNMLIPRKVLRWRFTPVGGDPWVLGGTSACPGNSVSCRVKLFNKGTMEVDMIVNGKEMTAEVYIDKVKCLTGDTIIDSDSVRKALNDAWKRSNADSSGIHDSLKIETAIAIYEDTLTHRRFAIRINDPNATGCGISVDIPGNNPPRYIGDAKLVAIVHSHPHKPNQWVYGCVDQNGNIKKQKKAPDKLGGGGSGYQPGSSGGDWPVAGHLMSTYGIRVYTMGTDGNLWRLDPSVLPKDRPSNPNKKKWRGGSCNWFPVPTN